VGQIEQEGRVGQLLMEVDLLGLGGVHALAELQKLFRPHLAFGDSWEREPTSTRMALMAAPSSFWLEKMVLLVAMSSSRWVWAEMVESVKLRSGGWSGAKAGSRSPSACMARMSGAAMTLLWLVCRLRQELLSFGAI
jgi:hypothetical protein